MIQIERKNRWAVKKIQCLSEASFEFLGLSIFSYVQGVRVRGWGLGKDRAKKSWPILTSEASYRRSDTKISQEAERNEGRLVEIDSERPTSFPNI